MFHHHPLAQALPPRLGLVMGAGLLLQSFFGLDADTPRPLPTDALRAQGTGLTSGLRKKELAPSTFSGGAIVARGLARRAAHFHFFYLRLQHSFALLHQLQSFLLIPSIARQHLHPGDQLTLHLHRHRCLVSVEALAGALASMPHLGIVDTNDSILFCARLHLAAA